ncbi:MAG: type II CAAX endopeptidase family protein [Planctomycetota bacterium]|jgi:hypothetical protein|nr:type II CAAX endopeptidase family protein [Planctomycetota bacterium]
MNPPPNPEEPIPNPDPAPHVQPQTLESDPELFRRVNIRLALGFYGLLLAGSILGSRWIGHGPLHWIPSGKGFGNTILSSLLLGLATGGLVVGLGHLLTPYITFLQQMKEGFREPLLWVRTWKDIFILAVTSSVAEEALFRGCLQPAIGIGWTSLIFAFCHPPIHKKLIAWPLFAWLISYLLGNLYIYGGDALIAPILCHFTINFCNLGILTARDRASFSAQNEVPKAKETQGPSS